MNTLVKGQYKDHEDGWSNVKKNLGKKKLTNKGKTES